MIDGNHLFCLKKKTLAFDLKRWCILHIQSKIPSNYKIHKKSNSWQKKMENLDKNWHKSFWELQLANYSGAHSFTFSYNNLN